MDPFVAGILALFLAASGGIIASFVRRLNILKMSTNDLENRLLTAQAFAESTDREKSGLHSLNSELDKSNRDLSTKLTSATSDLKHLEERFNEQKKQFSQSSEQMLTQFEVLSGRILEAQSDKFVKTSQLNLQSVLSPLKDHLQLFQKKVEDTHIQDVRDRTALEEQIKNLASANGHLIAEANNLARALKGNAKTQGNWGEIMLERILESAGLREGHEFTREGAGMTLYDDNGKLQKPDVVLNLPEDKHIVIDSKVSLVAYERSVNVESEDDRVKATRDHIDSIERHVSQLAGKHYSKNRKLNAPDFVLMFMPVESALSSAYLAKPELFQLAWAKGVIIASPTTLIATAQTVSSIWRMENQNLNSLKIAEQGARLYDKFVGFVEDMEQTKKSFDTLGKNFDQAMNKLCEGKGNLVSSADKLTKLGVQARKKLKTKYLDDHEESELVLNEGVDSDIVSGASRD